MFCTNCGTEIEPANFCKNCGARLGRDAGLAADAPRAQPAPGATASESGGSNRLIIGAAGIAVLLLAAGGIYFGTELLKPSRGETPTRAAAPAAKSAEVPPLPSFEESKETNMQGETSEAVNPPGARERRAPPQGEARRPPTELSSEPARKTDLPSPSKSQFKRPGEEPPLSRQAGRRRAGRVPAFMKRCGRLRSTKTRPRRAKLSPASRRVRG